MSRGPGWILSALCIGLVAWAGSVSAAGPAKKFHGVYAGMDARRFLKIYPKQQVRSYRSDGTEEWITYNEPLKGPATGLVTFHFKDDIVLGWAVDDRPEVVDEYLNDFCSLQRFPVIFAAIKNVLNKMPYKDFLAVTRRERPVIFTEFYDSGTARFASSQEFSVSPGDPPCCSEGFTLIKVGLGLGKSETPGPIEGVIAHEVAHRVLDHIRRGRTSCNAEREANALIREWGFKEEFKKAGEMFGQKHGDPAPCQEESPST